MPEVQEIRSKSALGKSGISDYCFNPFVGCAHSCLYCYARFSGRLVGHGLLDWGEYVCTRSNILDVLALELPRKKPGDIFISSITDPYQALEERYQLTRGALQMLSSHPSFSVTVQTKSPLVLRDIDVLETIKGRCEIGFTISMSDDWSKVFEPGAPSPSSRLKALHELHSEGFRTYAFVGPVIPGLDDPIDVIASIKDSVRRIYLDKLNLRPGVWASIKPTLDHLGLSEKVWEAVKGSTGFYKDLREDASRYCSEKGLEVTLCY